MTYRFQFRPYRLPFRVAVRTAHGFWAEREGVLVRLEDETGMVGLGEAAPIPEFGTESIDEIAAVCRDFGAKVESTRLEAIPAQLPCLRNALSAAMATKPESVSKHVAALLPAGRGAIEQLKEKADSGFRVFKWKVGVRDVADELPLLDDLCAEMPATGKLRLDANGAWDRRRAERWLERCADRPIEYIEQPCGAEDPREMDLLLGLAGDYPTPLALDESLVRDGDVERWLGAGWPGVYVVKPTLFGDAAAALGRLAKAKAPVVFSSALETAVGARTALRMAFAWQQPGVDAGTPPRALGFGVWPLFADRRFDGPATAPFLRSEDVERINVEAAWNALS
jgi:O-succinylbenzoate synthase